jgi:hypothetical protein
MDFTTAPILISHLLGFQTTAKRSPQDYFNITTPDDLSRAVEATRTAYMSLQTLAETEKQVILSAVAPLPAATSFPLLMGGTVRSLLACLCSSLIVAGVVAAYSIFENGIAFEVLGVMLIAFLFALAASLLIGVPIHCVLQRLGRRRKSYYGMLGSMLGAAFTIIPLVTSRLSDPSLLKLTIILAIAGLLSGLTFHRIVKA